jgi:hypothetical protein
MRIKTFLALALLYLISSSIWLIRFFYFRIHRKGITMRRKFSRF